MSEREDMADSQSEDLTDAQRIRFADVIGPQRRLLRPAARERVPMSLVESLLAGELPLRVWRVYRKLSVPSLAQAVGGTMTPKLLRDIEAGRAMLTRREQEMFASILRVDPEDLEPWEGTEIQWPPILDDAADETMRSYEP